MIETYTYETFQNVKVLADSIVTVRELERVLSFVSEKPPVLEYKRNDIEDDEVQTVELDKTLIMGVKGGGFGAYIQLRNEGYQELANITMIREGISQKLTLKQEEHLMEIDKRYHLYLTPKSLFT